MSTFVWGRLESTILECLDDFTRTMIDLYGRSYLRPPNAEDIARLLQKAEERGFPGMIGSIDCMHWEWEEVPYRLAWSIQGALQKNPQLSLRL